MTKIILITLSIACALILPASASAIEEFSKVGNQIQAKGETVVFAVPGAIVTCESSGGSGKVVSKTQIKSKITIEKCTSNLGKEEGKAAATVTACNIAFNSNDTLSLEGGCKIESEGCVIEPSSTSNKQLKAAGYYNLKEEEKAGAGLEAETEFDAGGITYTANATCEKLAEVTGGKEGALLGALTVEDADLPPDRAFYLMGGATESVKYVLENVGSQIFTIPGSRTSPSSKTITCEGLVFSGVKSVERNPELEFTTLSFTNCKTKILSTTEEAIEVEAGTGCKYSITPFAAQMVPPFPSGMDVTRGTTCAGIKGKVQACEIKFPPGGDTTGIMLTNVAGPPKKVTVGFSEEPGFPWRLPFDSANCTLIRARGIAILTGESRLKAQKTADGGNRDVEVR